MNVYNAPSAPPARAIRRDSPHSLPLPQPPLSALQATASSVYRHASLTRLSHRTLSHASSLLPRFRMSTPTPEVTIQVYRNERDLHLIKPLIGKDLSEPYSIFTYRYFVNHWPDLCYLAMEGSSCVGAVVCKLEPDKRDIYRGYIAMLAVREDRRKMGLGSRLVAAAIQAMIAKNCEEVTLEAEVTNKGALRLYENLGFIRDKRFEKYYLNGNDAFRLKLRLSSFPVHTQIKF